MTFHTVISFTLRGAMAWAVLTTASLAQQTIDQPAVAPSASAPWPIALGTAEPAQPQAPRQVTVVDGQPHTTQPSAVADAPTDTPAMVITIQEPALPPPLVAQRATSDRDLWERIRRGFAVPDLSDSYVSSQEQWYGSRPDYIQRIR